MVSNLHEEREGRVGNVGRRMISIDDKLHNGVLSNTYQRRISEEEEEGKRIDIAENQRNNESECMHVFILLFDEMSPATCIITTKNTRKISY